MKITVSTFYDPSFKPLAEITNKNHQAWCDKHGYEYKVTELEKNLEGNGYERLCEVGKIQADLIFKILTVQHLSIEYPCYLFTLGCDTVITNMKTKIDDLADKKYDIIVGTDRGGINASQQFIRNIFIARYYYSEMIDWISKGGEHDQAFFHSHPQPFILPVKQNIMNSYDCEARKEPPETEGNWKEGDFLVHLAGMTLEQRMARIDYWMGRVK